MTITPKKFVFNLMRIKHPNISDVKEVIAQTRKEAEQQIPEGWQIITCKELEIP